MLALRILEIMAVLLGFGDVGRAQLKWEQREIAITAGTTASEVSADFAFTIAGWHHAKYGV